MSKFKFSEDQQDDLRQDLKTWDQKGMSFDWIVKAIEDNINNRIEQIVSERDGWIDVDDTPPPSYQRVLFWDSRDCNVCVGYFVWDQTPVNYVTHWQPLPSPPKQPTK